LGKAGDGVNYIREIRAFYDWLEVNSLPTGAIALWYALMYINNKTGWSREFTVANIRLQSLTGLSRQGLDKARNHLIQRGLIEYDKGKGNQAGKYRLRSICQIVGTVVDTIGAHQETQKETQKGHSGSHSSSTLNKHKHKHKHSNIISLTGNSRVEDETAAPTEPDINQQVQAVWDYYLERLREIDRKALAIQSLNPERRKLTKARRAKIRARLDEFGLEDCKVIIDNALSSPFMLGHNDSQRFYGEIETIFRNTEKAERWLLNPPQKQIGGRNGGENRERAGGQQPNRRSGNGEVPKRGKYDHLIRDAGTGQFIGHPPGEGEGKTENHGTGPGNREDGF
jgi:hypothetical protein